MAVSSLTCATAADEASAMALIFSLPSCIATLSCLRNFLDCRTGNRQHKLEGREPLAGLAGCTHLVILNSLTYKLDLHDCILLHRLSNELEYVSRPLGRAFFAELAGPGQESLQGTVGGQGWLRRCRVRALAG